MQRPVILASTLDRYGGDIKGALNMLAALAPDDRAIATLQKQLAR